ncbi:MULTISPECIES: serine hydrolase [unclassified Roseateles]|uniref:serine hydrolase domain-containing protein n=1 Tax=unclassified Roseateles TaxID=2626991 RepID=UPI00138F8AF2|nr:MULTISPECIES: serine hydrolase domain-containing protein [unclassified Roseateles]
MTRTAALALCLAVVGNVHAVPCKEQPGAAERRQAVERGLLPAVVFDDEVQPQTLAARMLEHGVPGLAIAVLRGGEVDWVAVHGRRASQAPAVGCATLFQAGSLAKPVTVLAALRLQDAGRLDWDCDVNGLLTSLRLPAGRQTPEHPVTLRGLLVHTAGITPGGYPGYAQAGPVPTAVDVATAAPGTNTPRPEVVLRPGEQLRYSGGGYTLAQLALQDSQKLAFEPLMQRWLFQPLGLSRATFALQRQDAGGDVAAGHGNGATAVPGGWLHLPESAAAGLWSNAGDLAALLAELRKGWQGRSQVFQQSSVRALLGTPVERHLYGFRLVGDGKEQFLVHYGGTTGYNAGMAVNLQTGDGVVYLANAEAGRELSVELLAAVSHAYGWTQFRETRVRRAERDEAALHGLAGRYRFANTGVRVQVEQTQAQLTLVFPNGDRLALTPITADGVALQFIHPTGVRVGFRRGEAGAVTMHLYGNQGVRENSP